MSLNRSVAIALTVLATLSVGRLAEAADISVAPDKDLPGAAIVTIDGEMVDGDGSKFSSSIAGYQSGLVIFSSPGGDLFAGLQIGQMIRAHRFVTAVPDGAYCASACALAWLGGVRRFMQGHGLVGFHAAYKVDPSGEKSESGVGNALVGAYLDRLGLADNAIVYIETASPDSITWLTSDDARTEGIAVDILPSTPSEPASTAATNSSAPSSTATFDPPSFAPLEAGPEQAPQIATFVAPRTLSNPLETASQTLEQRAAAFAQDYFSRWSEGNDQALSYFSGVYAPRVDYYGKKSKRADILHEKQVYAARWPMRIYTVRPGSTTVTCDAGTDSCAVAGVVEWDCKSPSRGAHSVGAANFALQVTLEGIGPTVISESGSVISRKAIP